MYFGTDESKTKKQDEGVSKDNDGDVRGALRIIAFHNV